MTQHNADHDATHEPEDAEILAAEETICLPEYWRDLPVDANQMARAMGELDNAIREMENLPIIQTIAICAILNALHHIQKQAITTILEEA